MNYYKCVSCLIRLTTIFVIMITITQPSWGQQMQGFNPNDKLAPDFKLTPFYESGTKHVGKRPGEIIRTEEIPAPEGANAWRMMYVSTTWDNREVPVTGIIVIPKEKASKPRPVVTWAHGTTGGSRTSAPSLAPNPAQELVQRSETAPVDYGVPYLKDLLAIGLVVVATDYQGQGAPGVHQYVVGNTAARNALDIVRAARNFQSANAGSEFLTLGWSQGGHAGIFVGEEQPSYAPELKHLGAAVIAPGAIPVSKPINIPHIYVLARGYRDAYKLDLSEFTDEGKKLIDLAGEISVTRVFRASLEMKGPFIKAEWSKDFARALEQNIPGKRQSKAPILVVQGTIDNLVNPEETRALLPRALASGNNIKISWYEGKGHRDVIEPARKEIIQWYNDRLKGKPAISDQPK